MKVYEYKACSTCRKAVKFLNDNDIAFEAVPIVDRPPTKTELKKMLNHLKSEGGSLKNLFNTSGELYREFKVADQLKAGMSEAEALELLSANGKLIKRPFVLVDEKGLVGFDEAEWKKFFKV
ncbi:MAG TPA: Spx/MgsR family RNA polymerase-binding regulatory protein [Bdellovibrionales bacterium]|nr:Spx/MgsR family RNA polymerase-binding regulatory protein [Bdellovibrionales bacterium]